MIRRVVEQHLNDALSMLFLTQFSQSPDLNTFFGKDPSLAHLQPSNFFANNIQTSRARTQATFEAVHPNRRDTRCVQNTQCTSGFLPLNQCESFTFYWPEKNPRIRVLRCGPAIQCRRMLCRLVASRSIVGRIGVSPLSFLCFIVYIP